LLEVHMVAWLKRAELSSLVDEDHLTALDIHEHVGLAIAVDIAEGERHRGQSFSWPDQGRAEIHLGFGGIAPGKLDDLHLPVEVEGEEVAGVVCRVAVANYGVRLEGAGTPIAQVILVHAPPTDEGQRKIPQEEHTQHAQPKVKQPVPTRATTAYRFLLFLQDGNLLFVLRERLVLSWGLPVRSQLVLRVVLGMPHVML